MAAEVSEAAAPWLPILYGSQTGTAQEVAEYLEGMVRRRGFRPWLGSLDAFPLEALPLTGLAVFVIATTGDGEPPDNMKKAWKFLLRRALPGDSLAGMKFAMLGLGDTTYEKYCAAARRLGARLGQLGATPLISAGYADEQAAGGIWQEVDTWTQALCQALLPLSPMAQLAATDDDMDEPPYIDDTPVLEPPLYTVEVLPPSTSVPAEQQGLANFYAPLAPPDAYLTDAEAAAAATAAARADRPPPPPQRMPFRATLRVNARLTSAAHAQDVRHLELDVSGMGRARGGCGGYSAGDVAVVHPQNAPAGVAAFAKVAGLDLDATLRIARAPPPPPRSAAGAALSPSAGASEDGALRQDAAAVAAEPSPLDALLGGSSGGGGGGAAAAALDLPSVCTVRELLTRYLDILGAPRRAFFDKASLFARDEEEEEKLLDLGSTAGADLLHEYAVRERRTHAEVLQDFPSCRPPLARLLEMIPRLRPRAFSIASSSLAHPGQVHLCVAVVSYKTRYKREKAGVCSTWLAALKPGDTVPLWLRPGTFRLPRDPHTPVILIGPGTGIAPMRSILQQRQFERAAAAAAHDGSGSSSGAAAATGTNGGSAAHTAATEQAAAGQNGSAASTATDNNDDDASPSSEPPDTLYFGCRHKAHDFHYAAELCAAAAARRLRLRTAFSRDAPRPGGGKWYVQHRIAEGAAAVARAVLARGAHVYVSGSAQSMPRDVRAAVAAALVSAGGLSNEEAERYLKAMEREGRYAVEAWS
ncbi:hypothetical protein JKP88DRAFT_330120 [Tribonema minus]|uniref:NADPH-dependent diflavin oxidoreductase 1 n=1 Tax=Tribonema minus TaxID=303371 RepID=A0A836CAI2_9STRA|nr:hypothetical protein JKP88DRAFT_330120 [Tribonema minus]